MQFSDPQIHVFIEHCVLSKIFHFSLFRIYLLTNILTQKIVLGIIKVYKFFKQYFDYHMCVS